MRDWTNEAASAAKIARDNNLFAKKDLLLKIYSSDFYLKDKKTKGGEISVCGACDERQRRQGRREMFNRGG